MPPCQSTRRTDDICFDRFWHIRLKTLQNGYNRIVTVMAGIISDTLERQGRWWTPQWSPKLRFRHTTAQTTTFLAFLVCLSPSSPALRFLDAAAFRASFFVVAE